MMSWCSEWVCEERSVSKWDWRKNGTKTQGQFIHHAVGVFKLISRPDYCFMAWRTHVLQLNRTDVCRRSRCRGMCNISILRFNQAMFMCTLRQGRNTCARLAPYHTCMYMPSYRQSIATTVSAIRVCMAVPVTYSRVSLAALVRCWVADCIIL